jgi:purine-nucleoside phosphorylase
MTPPNPLAALADPPPQVAVVLGSGMGPIVRRLAGTRSIPFVAVPGLEAPSVAGHRGYISVGRWAGQRVLVFEGRLHGYEGHPWRRVVLPVQTAAALGVRVLLLTNAAGGIHAALGPGSFLAIRDHIDWTRPYCWRDPGAAGLGGGRTTPYAARLLGLLARAARGTDTPLIEGIYAAVTGPNYETPAEIRALKACGADAVGMSTTREAEAACEAGLECAGLSCITNKAAGLKGGPLTPEEVLATAAAQSERLADLIEAFLRLL